MRYIYLLIFVLLSSIASAQTPDKSSVLSNETIQVYTYPNPVTTRLVVRISNNFKQQVHKVEIVNIIGKKIKEQQLLDKNTTEIYFNDLAEVPQGIYLVIARDENGKVLHSNKFLIEK